MSASGYVYRRCPRGCTDKPCKKSHGTWSWRSTVTADGQREQPGKGGYPTKGAAQEALTAFNAKRDQGRHRNDRKMTVGQWFDRWLEEGEWELLTRDKYEGHLRTVWRPHLADVRLRDLTKRQVEAVLRKVSTRSNGRKLAPKTLQSYRGTLSAALQAAVDSELISTNVAAGAMRALPAVRQGDLVLWEPSELRLFLDVTEDSADRLRAMWPVVAFTGLRREEVCGIRWSDITLKGKTPGMTIRQVVPALAGLNSCRVCGGEHRGCFIKPSPKTAAGYRWVPLVAEAITALTEHKARQATEREKWTEALPYSDHGLVFAQEDGSPLNPSAVSQRFSARVTKLRHPQDPAFRLPPIRLHDLRHSAATLMATAGVPMELVAQILGHSSPAITRRIYTHVLRGPAIQAVEAAASVFRAHAGAHAPGSTEVMPTS